MHWFTSKLKLDLSQKYVRIIWKKCFCHRLELILIFYALFVKKNDYYENSNIYYYKKT